MLKVLFFIQGFDVPSARFRVLQYIDALSQMGIESKVVACSPPFSSEPKYFRTSIVYCCRNIVKALSYVRGLLAAERFDVVFVQREMTLYSWTFFEEYLGRRHRPAFVFDFDDSIHLLYENPFDAGGKLPRILRATTLAIAGNSYLADYARRFQSNVRILPTPVCLEMDDTAIQARMERLKTYQLGNPYTIGWSGTRSNLPYLRQLVPALTILMQKYPFVRLHLMSNFAADEHPVIPLNYEYTEWSGERESEVIRSFDCGVMPLADDEWTRGKCSFKMLQYMSHLVPSIASFVGMNAEVVTPGKNGLLAQNDDEWLACFERLITAPDFAASLADNALQKLRVSYCVDVCAPKLSEFLHEAVELKKNGVA